MSAAFDAAVRSLRLVAILRGVELETLAARDASARFIKLFPASAFGSEYVKALLGPYPGLELLAVGGVGSANLAPYLRAGAIGAGAGGALASGSPSDDFAAAAAEARALVTLLGRP